MTVSGATNATHSLECGGVEVPAAHVHAAMLAALSGFSAHAVTAAERLFGKK